MCDVALVQAIDRLPKVISIDFKIDYKFYTKNAYLFKHLPSDNQDALKVNARQLF